jgi:hypothetical protein
MTPEERQLLSSLFDRVKGAAQTPRDPQAEGFIAERVREQPYAPYVFSQTVIVQEEALKAAASRIQELEGQLAEARRAQEAGSSSFLGGIGKSLFGGEPERPARTGSGVPAFGPGVAREAGRSPWANSPMQAPQPPQSGGPFGGGAGFAGQAPMGGQAFGGGQPQGGGFLRTAMTTAAGVAGGALLFQGISSLFNTQHGQGSFLAGQGLTDSAAAATGSAAAGTTDVTSIGSDIFGAKPEAAAAAPPDDDFIAPASYADDTDDDPGFEDGGGFDSDPGDGGDWA